MPKQSISLPLQLPQITQTIYIKQTLHGIITSIHSTFENLIAFQNIQDVKNYYLGYKVEYVVVV